MKKPEEEYRLTSQEQQVLALELPGNGELRYFAAINKDLYARSFDPVTKSILINSEDKKRLGIEVSVDNRVDSISDDGFFFAGGILVIDNGTIEVRGKMSNALNRTLKVAALRPNQVVITGLIKETELQGNLGDIKHGAWLEKMAPVDQTFSVVSNSQ